jgi:hypothetical protein
VSKRGGEQVVLKSTQMQFRVSQDLKDKFIIWCALQEPETDSSRELRNYMMAKTKDINLEDHTDLLSSLTNKGNSKTI